MDRKTNFEEKKRKKKKKKEKKEKKDKKKEKKKEKTQVGKMRGECTIIGKTGVILKEATKHNDESRCDSV